MNTDQYYNALKIFMSNRKKINEDYLQALRRLESAQGSPFYDIEKKKLDERRERALKKEKDDARRSVRAALGAMRSKLKTRQLQPLTDDQLRILQTLRMRATVSEDELNDAAQSMDHNEQGLEVLAELRKRNGFHGNYRHLMRRYPTKRADAVLANLEKSARDILDSSAAPAALMAAKHHADLYGGEQPDELKVRQREMFENKSDFLRQTGFLWSGTDEKEVNAFCNAIDG